MSFSEEMKLPRMNPEAFNLLASEFKWGVVWKDSNGDMLPRANEIEKGPEYAGSVERFDWFVRDENDGAGNIQKKLTDEFTTRYNSIYLLANERRVNNVHRELELTYRDKITTDLEKWLKENTDATPEEIVNYKAGVREILKAAAVMKELYQRQIGYSDQLKKEANSGKLSGDDLELIDRYGHPWCLGNQGAFCTSLPSLAARGSGIFLNGATCEETGKDVNSYGNPFSVIARGEKGELIRVPYAEMFVLEQRRAGTYFMSAAEYFSKIPREAAFVKHLLALAGAMDNSEPFPYFESDRAWHEHGASDSIFLLRAGADETGGDGVGDTCETKARFHLSLGLLASKKVDGLKKAWSSEFQTWENGFAGMIGNPDIYKAQEVAMSIPEFYDIIYAVGDDVGGPNGTSIGQTLPNWCGKDGIEKPCKRRVLIYVNKTLKAYNDAIVNKYLKPLFDPAHYDEFTFEEDNSGIESVLAHEIAHNFGPQPGKPIPGSTTTYESRLGDYKGVMEELKAQTGSMFIAGQLLKKARAKFAAGETTKAELEKAERHFRKHMLYDMTWAMKMILRATRGGKFEGTTYSKLAAIQVGYLAENGALTYNTKTQQWRLNFEDDKFLNVINSLMEKTLKLYAEGNLEEVSTFVKDYIEAEGKGFKMIHAERIVEVARNMPSPLFDYTIEGL